jgi:hypothetical protein
MEVKDVALTPSVMDLKIYIGSEKYLIAARIPHCLGQEITRRRDGAA